MVPFIPRELIFVIRWRSVAHTNTVHCLSNHDKIFWRFGLYSEIGLATIDSASLVEAVFSSLLVNI